MQIRVHDEHGDEVESAGHGMARERANAGEIRGGQGFQVLDAGVVGEPFTAGESKGGTYAGGRAPRDPRSDGAGDSSDDTRTERIGRDDRVGRGSDYGDARVRPGPVATGRRYARR